MLIDNLNTLKYDFDSLPDELKRSIDVLTDLRIQTKGQSDQRLGVLDYEIFQSILLIDPTNKAVQEVKTDLDFDRKLDSNNSFNSVGIVSLSGDQMDIVEPVNKLSLHLMNVTSNPVVKELSMFNAGGLIGNDKIKIEDLANKFDYSNLVNNGYFQIGYRKSFLKNPILIGRRRNLILPNMEVHDANFAVVDLDWILASNHEVRYSTTKGYPTNEDGSTINDRNYAGDQQAQHKVGMIAKSLEPSLLLSNSVDVEGTPIITVDGIVVSGNNRIMSMKLARDSYPDQYEKYVDALKEEIEYGGFGFSDMDLLNKIKNPVLVRIDFDFQSYLTEEMNKYNVESKKSERPIDRAMRISRQLKDNKRCQESLQSLISEQETVSELNNSPDDVKRLKNILLECNLISNNQLSMFFEDKKMSDNGKILYEVILSSLVLSPKALEISQKAGVVSATGSIVNAIIPAIKNKQLKEGSLNEDINRALLLQNRVVSSDTDSILSYINEPELFKNDIEPTFKSSVINYHLTPKSNKFKKLLAMYNTSMDSALMPSLLDDQLSPKDIFQLAFVDNLPDKAKRIITLRFDKNQTPVKEKSPIEDLDKVKKEIEVLKSMLNMHDGDDLKEIEAYIKTLEEKLN